MQVTHDELVLVLNRKFPDLRSNKDYFVAMPVAEDTGEQIGDAFIVEWRSELAQPTPEQLLEWVIEDEVLILSTRALNERLATYLPISARQLWLMARQIGISKADILDRLKVLETDTDDVKEKKEILYIELTEPPLNGFLRDSPTTEDFREMLDIPFDQFDDLWVMAQRL